MSDVKIYSTSYIFKVWVTTIGLSPLIYLFVLASHPPTLDEIPDIFNVALVMGIFGVLFSAPFLLIYYIVFTLLKKTTLDEILIKLILILVTVTGIISTLYIFLEIRTANFTTLFGKLQNVYIGVNIAATFIFRIKIPQKVL